MGSGPKSVIERGRVGNKRPGRFYPAVERRRRLAQVLAAPFRLDGSRDGLASLLLLIA